MAKFDYRCDRCGLILEEDGPDLLVYEQHRADHEPVEYSSDFPWGPTSQLCTGKFRRIYSFGGAIFKGSGFYRTDNRESRD